ncbi:unnamed protein product [Thelazia callipaeda]|uniref:Dehydrogenase/reductase SDR family member 1 n=1 Tax=Thelazia callipaeda TaxID=103827 RepID=A0A0N5CLP4_THECL|nr:unnamed protein product [Thelazia callipaeda]
MALRGKVALVTGASRGIGRGIALQLGEAGATVYVTGRHPDLSLHASQNTLPTLKATAEDVTARGGKGIAVYVDHSNMSDVEKLFKRIDEETNGHLDILVNNAFSAVPQLADLSGQKFWEVSPELWDEVNNVGLRNNYYCCCYAARIMVRRCAGLIVNISSAGGLVYLFSVPYGVGKTANDRMASDMAIELRRYGITVVSIWPGPVRTEVSVLFFSDIITEFQKINEVYGSSKTY